MQFLKRISFLGLAMSLLASVPAEAQFQLPTSHNNQHQTLIANQRPAGVDLEALKISALKNQQAIDLAEDDLFNYNWSSQSITTAYAGLTIPQTRAIDVSGFTNPLKTRRVTSNYGFRPRFGRMHKGIDLGLNVGDTVVAAFDGRVRITKYEGKGYGYYVVVRHDNGLETVYGHLSRFLVKPNQYVRAGQPIALGGNTGRSTGPHLHFETRFMGLAINPAAIIDFENGVAHKDVFVFEKTTYEKGIKYGPVKSKKGKYAKKSKRSKKSTASKRKKSRRKRR